MRLGLRANIFLILGTLAVFVWTETSYAKTAEEIDTKATTALERFRNEVYGSGEIMSKAKGVLIFPRVYKGGFVFGAEYGEGALRVNGVTVDYYNIISGTFGFQLGGQAKTMFVFFMEQTALDDFRESNGWRAGVDGSVALISIGANGSIDTLKTNEPIVGIVMDQKGLMYNLTLEGSKFTKLDK